MDAKPLTCQLFPYELIQAPEAVYLDTSYASAGAVVQAGPLLKDQGLEPLVRKLVESKRVFRQDSPFPATLVRTLHEFVRSSELTLANRVARCHAVLSAVHGSVDMEDPSSIQAVLEKEQPAIEDAGEMPMAGRLNVLYFISAFSTTSPKGRAREMMRLARLMLKGQIVHPALGDPVTLEQIRGVADDFYGSRWESYVVHLLFRSAIGDPFDPQRAAAELVTAFGYAVWLTKLSAVTHGRTSPNEDDTLFGLQQTGALLSRYHRIGTAQIFERTVKQFQTLFSHRAFLAGYLLARP
jgi:hypothetical protein